MLPRVVVSASRRRGRRRKRPTSRLWQGPRALADIAKQLSFGVRALDTPGHQKTIDYIEAELAPARHRDQRAALDLDASAAPTTPCQYRRAVCARERRAALILGTHYDSIVRAYRDKDHPDAPMPGANNSASGVALLLETARALHGCQDPAALRHRFVFFDGEEGPISLGAGDPHWQRSARPISPGASGDFYPAAMPEKAAIFDMVCWRDEKLEPELSSLDDASDEVEKFWTIGRTFAPGFFSLDDRRLQPIFDDQTALNEREDSELSRHRFRIRALVQHHAGHARQMLRAGNGRCRAQRDPLYLRALRLKATKGGTSDGRAAYRSGGKRRAHGPHAGGGNRGDRRAAIWRAGSRRRRATTSARTSASSPVSAPSVSSRRPIARHCSTPPMW